MLWWLIVLTVAIVVQQATIQNLKRRLEECCDTANEARTGAKNLWDWAKALQLKAYLECAAAQNGCGQAGDWPPEDPGDFPGA